MSNQKRPCNHQCAFLRRDAGGSGTYHYYCPDCGAKKPVEVPYIPWMSWTHSPAVR